jgi:hypothetical protein
MKITDRLLDMGWHDDDIWWVIGFFVAVILLVIVAIGLVSVYL